MNFHIILTSIMTVYIAILVPIYWVAYGFQNFLWFSDVGLFLTVAALWLQSRLLMSIVAVAILPVEILWNIDFFIQLITSDKFLGISNYMLDPSYSIFLRTLSLFHMIIPIFVIGYTVKWGYERRALGYAIMLVWVILIATYLISEPKINMNWVFMPAKFQWTWMPELVWLGSLMIGFPLLIIVPMHLILERIARKSF